jgi:hypothetical protein
MDTLGITSALSGLNGQYDNSLGPNSSLSGTGNSAISNFANDSGDAPCFNKGTFILILNKNMEEEWVPIETLTLGTLIKSYLHGYRKLKFIGCGTLKNHVDDVMGSTMYRLPKEGDMPDDLIITRGHSILVDTMDEDEATKNLDFFCVDTIPQLDDKKLLLCCASKKFIQINDDNEYTYYHIVLEHDNDVGKKYGVWANGVLCETIPESVFISSI